MVCISDSLEYIAAISIDSAAASITSSPFQEFVHDDFTCFEGQLGVEIPLIRVGFQRRVMTVKFQI